MPGGYGTEDTPWGAAGDRGPVKSPSPPGERGGQGYVAPQPTITPNIPQQTTGTFHNTTLSQDPNDEKGDYMDWGYVNPTTGLTAGQTQEQAAAASKKAEIDRMTSMQGALNMKQSLGQNLNKWSDQDLLKAQEAGLFTGEAEGMLGGVTGYEKEVNAMKNAIASKMGRNIEGYQDPKRGLESLPEFQALTRLTGNPVLAAVNAVGVDKAIEYGIIDPNDPATENFRAQTTGDIGYDPTGRYTWEDVESDPKLYEAYQKLTGGDLKPDELREYLRYLDYGEQEPGGGGWQPQRQMSQRERNLALLRFLQGGSPIKQLEQSGFMGSMKDPYAESMKEAGEKGIFSGVSGTGITGEAMKHLLKSWGSGYSSPRYANVARGGIMSVWNDRR